MTAVAVREEAPPPAPAGPAAETTSFLQMIERVVRDPSTDIGRMERLLEMQERVMARNAKAAYIAALAEMQTKLPVIEEKGGIKDSKGKVQSTYALWEDINDAIKPILATNGFTLTFRTGRDGDKLTVTGILSHREGHSEETTLALPMDSSGSKNAVQAVGSSTSYGKRYTASALLNLTSRVKVDRDDDGRAAGIGDTISDDQLTAIRDEIDAVGADIEKFCGHFKIEAVPDLPAARFDEAMKMLQAKRSYRR